jgi:hypothetical protein
MGAGWTIGGGRRGLTGHFVKKRCSKASAQSSLCSIDELYDVITVKKRVKPSNGGLTDNGRSMNANKLLRVALVEHNHIIEQVPAATANETLRYSVLPRALEAGSFGLDAEALDRVDDFVIEVRAAVEDDVSRRGVVGKCFATAGSPKRSLGVW